VKKLIRFALPRSSRFNASLVIAVVQGLSAVALMGCSAWLISRAAEQPPIMYLSIAIVGVRTFALARASLRYAERWLSHDAVLRDSGQRRAMVFEKMIDFAPAGFEQNSISDLSARTVADVDESQNLALRVISPLVQSVMVSLISVVVFWFLLPAAAAVMGILLLLAFIVALPLSATIARSADRGQAQLRARLTKQSSELIEHFDLLVAYGWADDRLKALEETQARAAKSAKLQALSFGVSQATFAAFAAISAVVAAVIGAEVIARGQSDPVMLAVFALLPLAVFDVASASQSTVGAWRRYRGSAERLTELSERSLPPELQFASGVACGPLETIELKSVTLAYPNRQSVVNDFSLKLKLGETVALVGESGSGKSTIALALSRLLALRSGSYLVNGESVENIDGDSIRKRVGYLEQNPAVFATTVRVNLAIAKPDASDAEMLEVLEKVGLAQMFLAREGLDTLVGDRGALISGGEAQRLALARALLANFELIILDEPTANVDQKHSTKLIQDLIAVARDNKRMILLITHDEKLAKLASRRVAI
jgi:ATP-binding cassette subfamily C protein CydC